MDLIKIITRNTKELGLMSSGMLHRVAWCRRALCCCVKQPTVTPPADSTDLIRALLTADRSIEPYFVETVPFSFLRYFTLKMATVLLVESLHTAPLNSDS